MLYEILSRVCLLFGFFSLKREIISNILFEKFLRNCRAYFLNQKGK